MTDILPPNATKLEKAIDASAARISALDVRIKDLWNPEQCPAEFLPLLAAAFSVDHWDSAWTDDEKRAAIKASYRVHAHKGTRGAVKDALKALGIDANLEEWFAQSPQGARGTFTLRAKAKLDFSIDERRQKMAISAVASAKRASQHFTFGIEAGFGQRLGLAAGIGTDKSAALTGDAKGRDMITKSFGPAVAGDTAAHIFRLEGIAGTGRAVQIARNAAIFAHSATTTSSRLSGRAGLIVARRAGALRLALSVNYQGAIT